ncbi:MAG: hypothetical protein HDR26_04350 [Lachnospiraceae bacterium]|nr:hypothetical protein [Lachnospiraceae bacterium]
MKHTQKLIYCIFPIIGLICIFFSDHITALLPYLLGSAMTAAGILRVADCLRSMPHPEQDYGRLSLGLIWLVVGIMFLIQGQNAIGAVGTVWAIIGIRKAAQSLDQMFQQIHKKEHFALPALTFVVRMTLALALLFHPFEKFSSHIVILGFELIAISFGFSDRHISVGESDD